MDIHLSPDLEEFVRQDVQRGPYQTADEYVERAISLLHQQEVWLAEHREEIHSAIQEGFAAARRGNLLDCDEVRSQMKPKKEAWISEHSRG